MERIIDLFFSLLFYHLFCQDFGYFYLRVLPILRRRDLKDKTAEKSRKIASGIKIREMKSWLTTKEWPTGKWHMTGSNSALKAISSALQATVRLVSEDIIMLQSFKIFFVHNIYIVQ